MAAPEYWFEYHHPPASTFFVGKLQTRRCCHESCQVWVTFGGPYCREHTLTQLGLAIVDTPYGFGVQARRPFRQGQLICPYFAEKIPEVELTRRYGHAYSPYGLLLREGRRPVVDDRHNRDPRRTPKTSSGSRSGRDGRSGRSGRDGRDGRDGRSGRSGRGGRPVRKAVLQGQDRLKYLAEEDYVVELEARLAPWLADVQSCFPPEGYFFATESVYEDGALLRGIGTLMNHADRDSHEWNGLARLSRGPVVRAWIYAARDIQVGDEIRWDYGALDGLLWANPDVRYSTYTYRGPEKQAVTLNDVI